MTESELLEHIFERLARAEASAEIFSAHEARQWPDAALASLIKARLFRPAQPTHVIECDGCEKNCFKPVHVRPADRGQPARAFIACDEPEDFGRIPVELGRLKQWQITGETLVGAVGRLLGFPQRPRAEGTGKRWVLGVLPGRENKGVVVLSIENGAWLMLAGHSVALNDILTLGTNGLSVNSDVLIRIVDSAEESPPGLEAVSRQALRDAKIQAKYAELAQLGRRNYVKEIQRTVLGAESLSARRIRDIAKGR